MKHIKLYEEFVNESKTIQQKHYDSLVKSATKALKSWEQELKSAPTDKKDYIEDRIDTIARILANDTNLQAHADAAAATELGYDDPKVIQMDLDAAEEFLADREEVAKAIQDKIKKGEYQSVTVASNLVGSESDLKSNLKEIEATIKSLKTRIADLTKKLG
jgi:hypothetical protein